MLVAAQDNASSENGMASYYRARYYDQSNGRFLREDQVGFSAGVNFYAYVQNNSINFTDPTGNDIICPKFLPWCPNPKPPACKSPKNCNLSVSCLPTPNTRGFAHCTAYDGGPSGSIWWSKLIVIPGKGAPPGKNTFFTGPVPCDCAQKEASAINGYGLVYSAPLINSNTAASMITAACGVSPNWPSSAWGANNGNSP